MRREEFRRCCQAVEEGEEIYLENTVNHARGRILYCTAEEFQVRSDGERKIWSPNTCEEIGSSSEAPA